MAAKATQISTESSTWKVVAEKATQISTVLYVEKLEKIALIGTASFQCPVFSFRYWITFEPESQPRSRFTFPVAGFQFPDLYTKLETLNLKRNLPEGRILSVSGFQFSVSRNAKRETGNLTLVTG